MEVPAYNDITSGLITMLWGFFMKVVVADRIAILVDTVYDTY
jgi:D-alanyl-lipoteichoic acid acyltransferase DltB (MBOAT superfamily)